MKKGNTCMNKLPNFEGKVEDALAFIGFVAVNVTIIMMIGDAVDAVNSIMVRISEDETERRFRKELGPMPVQYKEEA